MLGCRHVAVAAICWIGKSDVRARDSIGLSVDNIRRHVRHIVETMPSRLAGSPNAARVAEYSADQLRAAGVVARVETIPGLVSFPREAELTIFAPEHRVLPANTFGHSTETLPEGTSGELVYVGSGHFSDYEGKDVAGKITVSELSYSPGRHEKQRIAALMGSTAQIMRNWVIAKMNACRWAP